MRKTYVVIALALGVGLVTLVAAAMPSMAKQSGHGLSEAGDKLYVTSTGADVGDCTDVISPCRTVQYAVDRAASGSVIKVAGGVYSDAQARQRRDVLNTGFVTQAVYVSKTVTLQGGYTSSNWITPDAGLNPTILDPSGRGRGLYVTGDVSVTVKGLRISSGDAMGLAGDPVLGGAGGGIYVTTATLFLEDNRIFSNTADVGGCVYVHRGHAILQGNVLRANVAADGGGVYLYGSTATLDGNRIAANIASWAGGGVYMKISTATLEGNVLADNVGHFSGGLHAVESQISLRGNTLISNTGGAGGALYLERSIAALDGDLIEANAASRGGGLFLGYGYATLHNATIADNRADLEGSGIYAIGASAHLLHATIARNRGGDSSGVHAATDFYGTASTVALTNTILVSHTVGITVGTGSTATLEATLWGAGAWSNASDGSGNVFTGTINLYGDPAFIDPDRGDYHVGLNSAAVDQGVDTGVEWDRDREPRPQGSAWDVGADEIGLVVTKHAHPTPARAGARLTYAIHVTNTSDVSLQATITDVLPSSVVPGVPQTGTVWLPSGKTGITWTAFISSFGGVWTRQFFVTVPYDFLGTLTNVVQVTTEQGATGMYTATTPVRQRVHLPLVMRFPAPLPYTCPTTSTNTYSAGVAYQYDPDDPVRPAYNHADKNISLRGYAPNPGTGFLRELVDYGSDDPTQPPQFATLFSPYRVPIFKDFYRVNNWSWAPPPEPGSRGDPITTWSVTALGLETTPGERLSVPTSGYDIGSGMEVIVLFADQDTVALKYARQDSAGSPGYTVHLDQICTDPNLLSLYNTLDNADGPRYQYPSAAYDLPHLAAGSPLGTARGDEVVVAIVDSGNFMDSRSCNEWWQIRPGYTGTCPPYE